MSEPVICIGGGVGVTFEEFYIDFVKAEAEKSSVPEISFKYRLPMLKRYQIDSLHFTTGYIMLRGDFGDYLLKSYDGTDNFKPKSNTVNEKSLPSPDEIDPKDVGKLPVLIYRRGKEGILTTGPIGSTGTFLRENEEKLTTLAVTRI
jgi:hypothetical protein